MRERERESNMASQTYPRCMGRGVREDHTGMGSDTLVHIGTENFQRKKQMCCALFCLFAVQ